MNPRRLQRRADAHLGLVDRIGQKVDRDRLLQPQLRGPLDGLDPADLVKTVAVLVVHLRKHRRRTFTAGAAHQGFVREHRAVVQIHDGLVRVVELKPQPRRIAAVFAISLRAFERHKVERKGGVGVGERSFVHGSYCHPCRTALLTRLVPSVLLDLVPCAAVVLGVLGHHVGEAETLSHRSWRAHVTSWSHVSTAVARAFVIFQFGALTARSRASAKKRLARFSSASSSVCRFRRWATKTGVLALPLCSTANAS